MASSNLQESPSTTGNDAWDTSRIPAALHTGTTNTGSDTEPNAYISDLSDYDRVEMILKDIRNKHRWSIGDFLHHMITAKSTKPYARTTDSRIKNLVSAIAQDDVLKPLQCSEKLRNIGTPGLISRLRTEIDHLGSGLGKFDAEASVHGLDIPHMYDRIQHVAPDLCNLLIGIMEPKHPSQRDTAKVCRGPITIICLVLAFAYAPRSYNNLPFLFGVHLHAMGVKRRTINVFHGFGITSSYQSIMRKRTRLSEIGKRQIKEKAQSLRKQIIVCYDNFDYSETVRHQTLREPARHICATTGKLCISHHNPPEGLQKSMFHPEIALDWNDICFAPGNLDDEIRHEAQRYWIAEAIRYTHPDAIKKLFMDNQSEWPQFPKVDRLPAQKTTHYSLSPILENEGTIDGTYNVIDKIFLDQFGYDSSTDFEDILHLIYGDQKTVSLIRAVMKERKEATLSYDKFNWILAVPGLFHWRTNYMDMIHDQYSGSECAAVGSTLYHNKNFLGCVQGHKSPFHHKEEVATRAFDARVTALYYQFLPSDIKRQYKGEIDLYIIQSGRAAFLDMVEKIRLSIFAIEEQCKEAPGTAKAARKQPQSKSTSPEEPSETAPIDCEFSAHAKFLQQMEIYKSLKLGIKLADIGMIRRILARSCILFYGGNKPKYAFLSSYMTWLTHTRAADAELQKAILANGLVNLRGAEDSWFEMDRLNEFFNLQMKNLMATRRTSTIDVATLFRNTALTASYCTDLKEVIEQTFGEHTNARHQEKDASNDVRNLAFEIYRSSSIEKHERGRDSPFQPSDIVTRGCELIVNGVTRFNQQVVHGQWADEDDTSDLTSTPIAALDDHISQEPED